MPFVTTEDDTEIYYEVHGLGADLVFISGFLGITDIWRRQIESLCLDYRCIAFDGRGAGRSDKPLPRIAYGVDRHAQDLATVLKTVDSNRSVLIGHSMGGNIACRYQLTHPQRVAGIAFLGSYAAGEQIAKAGNTLETVKKWVSKKENRIKFYEGAGIPYDLALESTKWPLYALQGNAESFMAFDVREQLSQITVPCLILHGEKDVVSPLDPCGHSLHDGLPDAELAVFKNVNHCPMLEDPEACNELLRSFLERRVAW